VNLLQYFLVIFLILSLCIFQFGLIFVSNYLYIFAATSPTRTRADSESASRQEFVIDLTKAVPNDSLPQINSPAEQEVNI